MIRKILVIGQAPPAQKQEVPYDTTQLYNWLSELGVSKSEAQDMFEWSAVYDKFPGYDKGSHAVPTWYEMEDYWETKLKYKVEDAQQIWILGRVAKNFLSSRPTSYFEGKQVITTIHPSKRNLSYYRKNKQEILAQIGLLLNR